MKTILSILLMTAVAWRSGAAELKVGTLDLQKAVSEYYKWQEATKQMKAKEAAYLKDLETLRLEGSRLLKEAQDLEELASSGALSLSQREEKKKSFEEKRVDLRQFQMRYDDFRSQKESELQTYSGRTKKQILDEVLSVTKYIGEKEGFNLVLNANKTDPAAGEVLFAKNVDDITGKVLDSLNATKSAQPASQPKITR